MDQTAFKLELSKLKSGLEELRQKEMELKLAVGKWNDDFNGFMRDSVGCKQENTHLVEIVEKAWNLRDTLQ